MIITNVCLLLEALSIVICLHHLYGEKFRLDIATVVLLAVDMIMMQGIDYLGLPSMVSVLIYPIIAIYCGVEFGIRVKKILINCMLSIIFVGVTQTVITFVICYIMGKHSLLSIGILGASCLGFMFVVFVLPKCKIRRLAMALQNNEKLLIAVIGISIVALLLWLMSYKEMKLLEAQQTILVLGIVVFILILAGELIMYKVKAREAEMELKMQKAYSYSFQGLIDNIRMKQHEFDNHINTIHSLHFSCNTFEELVEAQDRYCEHIEKENRFSKILTSENAVISSFLYRRFSEIDKMGIEIDYHIILNGNNFGIPIYKMVEILGDLINNAVEALEVDDKRNRLYVEVIENEKLCIEVRNESPYIAYDMQGEFFKKGFSKKGENRGLGLYNIKQICEKYGLEIAPKWMEINGKGWMSFKIWNGN